MISKMKMLLPINDNPLVRAFPAYSFVESIINNEVKAGNKLVEFELYGYEQNTWQTYLDDMTLKATNEILTICIEPYSRDAMAYIFRECRNEDELIIKINHLLPATPWHSICLFIDSAGSNEIIQKSIFSYVMGKFYSGGFFVSNHNQTESYISRAYIKENPCLIKITRLNNIISYWFSYDEEVWTQLETCEIDENTSSELYIGLYIRYGGHQYYHWLFSNFIQIGGGAAKTISIPLVYNTYTYKAYDIYPINPFVTTILEKRNAPELYGFSLWDYIVLNIKIGRYMQFTIDEYFIPGTRAFNIRHYDHENLVYGYDDSEKNIYLINYFNGKPCLLKVSYENFAKAFEASEYEFICIYEYYNNKVEYKMNIERICSMLQYYLTSKGYNDIGLGVCSEPLNVVYGIEIYDDFIKDYKSLDRILYDKTISYVIHEHKKIMQERLKYLKDSKVVTENEIKEIIISVNKLVRLSNQMMNIVIKNELKYDSNIYEKVTNYMKSMKEIEMDAYKKLYNILMGKLFRVSFNVKNLYGGLSASVDGIPILNNNLVLNGKNIVFSATPVEDYIIKRWTYQGMCVSGNTSNNFEVENLSSNIEVTVEFEYI